MKPPFSELSRIADIIHDEGFRFSEAYPMAKWKKNGWSEINDKLSFKVIDAFISLKIMQKEYEDAG